MMMFRVAAGARHLVARPMCTVGRRPAAVWSPVSGPSRTLLNRRWCASKAPLEQTPLEQATAAAQKAPGKLRDLWNKYGVVAVSTYAVTYVSTLGLIYALLESPFLSPGDSLRLLDSIGAGWPSGIATARPTIERSPLGRIFDLSQINPKAGSFAVACRCLSTQSTGVP